MSGAKNDTAVEKSRSSNAPKPSWRRRMRSVSTLASIPPPRHACERYRPRSAPPVVRPFLPDRPARPDARQRYEDRLASTYELQASGARLLAAGVVAEAARRTPDTPTARDQRRQAEASLAAAG